jgi:hypothetical protein
LTKNRKLIGIAIKSVIVLVSVFVVTCIILNRQYILDQITVWRFVPAKEALDLVNKAGMNDYGKFLYIASQPRLDSAADFNNNCQRSEATTSILGCYNNGLIYIYNVTDPKLDGVREVTAVHETLHAAYARLNDYKKSKINLLLEDEFNKLSADGGFRDRMAFYERTEAGQRYNELFAVVGSEVSSISSDLESYYDNYFSDRQKVVGLNKKYLTVFKTVQDQANALKLQMDSLLKDITDRTASYNLDIQTINNDIETFNSGAKNNVFLSRYDFDNQRADLISRINDLDAKRDGLNNDIARYNAISDEYNSLAIQSQNLYKSIDSNLAPAPSI